MLPTNWSSETMCDADVALAVADEISDSQLMGQAGGTVLQSETSSFRQVHVRVCVADASKTLTRACNNDSN